MTQREKLVGLLAAGIWNFSKDGIVDITKFADYLLENGVTVPKCRAGDKAYFVFFDDEKGIYDYGESTVKDVCNRGIFTSPFLDEREGTPENWELTMFDDEDLFFTKEEAEKAIEERSLESV